MSKSWVICSSCAKDFLKDNRHINENKKLGHKFYCSINCQSFFRNKQVRLFCENPVCNKEFQKKVHMISAHNYCSRSCAVIINNTKFPKRVAQIRKCKYCGNRTFNYRTYCSIKCRSEDQSINAKESLNQIKKFYVEHGRIPLKREFDHYHVARNRFGNWNNAVKAAGYKPNPIMFADKCLATDGHICDSIAEKIIDDYLFERGIKHERTVSYPGGTYTADFKIGDKLVEYFGLTGEHKRYDELRRIKKRIAKRLKLELIEIYPKDLYPHSRLEEILRI